MMQTQHRTRKVEKASQEITASLDQNARLCHKMWAWVLGSQDGPLKNSHQPVSPVPDPKMCVGWITEMLCSSDLFRELYNHELY